MAKKIVKKTPKKPMGRHPRGSARVATSGKTPPLSWEQTERWLKAGHDAEDWTRARVDPRFFSVPPAIEGVLGALALSATSKATQREIVAIANRAVGTYDERFPMTRRDIERLLVVSDWMLRCALPFWLDRLPLWCSARHAANALRVLSRLMWAGQLVDALAALRPVWLSLENDQIDKGTADEREMIWFVHRKATRTMEVLSVALTRRLHFGREEDAWFVDMALRISDGPGPQMDPIIAATIPDLVNVLLAVRHGDSQRCIADRCVWPAKPVVVKS